MSSSPGTNGTSFEAILFDVGGVMLTNGWDHNERKTVLEQFGLDRAEFEARHEAPYDAWERDATSPSDYLEATVFYQPRSFTQEQFLDAMKTVSLPIPSNAISVLKEISGKGNWLVGTLNNETRLIHEYRMRKYGIGDYLDIQLCSAYVGLRKPEPAIYRRAIDILGIPGERVLFIDDRANNAAAAAAAGMHAIQFQGEEKLRNDLSALGIL